MHDVMTDDFFAGERAQEAGAPPAPAPAPAGGPNPEAGVPPPAPAPDPAVEPRPALFTGPTLGEALNGVVPTDGESAPPAGAQNAQTGQGGSDDPWARYRDESGLIAGRYKTPEDAIASIAESDRYRGKLTTEVGELRDEVRRLFTGSDLEPQSVDPPALRATCEAARLAPSEMRMNQGAVDFAYNVAGWSPDRINEASTEDWRDLREEMRAGIRAAREEQRTAAVAEQLQQQAREERAFVAFETRYPDLAGRRTVVDAIANHLTAAGAFQPTMAMEQRLDLIADATRRQLLPTAPAGNAGPVPQPTAAPPTPPMPQTQPIAQPPAPRPVAVLPGGGAPGGGGGSSAPNVDTGDDFFNA